MTRVTHGRRQLTISSIAYSRFFKPVLSEKTRQSTRSGGTEASFVRSRATRHWYCLDRFVPVGMSQISRRSEVEKHERRTLNTWLSSDTSAGTFAVSASPSIDYRVLKQVVQKTWSVSGSNKGLEKWFSRFEPKILLISFSRGLGSLLIKWSSGIAQQKLQNRIECITATLL